MQDWKKRFNKGREIIVITSSLLGAPNGNIVISLGFINGKLLICNCQMSTTIDNLKNNNQICLISGYYKIKGRAEITESGKLFDICTEENKGSEYSPKHAISINVEEVYNLDKNTKLL